MKNKVELLNIIEENVVAHLSYIKPEQAVVGNIVTVNGKDYVIVKITENVKGKKFAICKEK